MGIRVLRLTDVYGKVVDGGGWTTKVPKEGRIAVGWHSGDGVGEE